MLPPLVADMNITAPVIQFPRSQGIKEGVYLKP